MKKSQLKEMIKSAMLAEASEFDTNKPERIRSFVRELDDLVEEYHAELYLNDALFAGIEAVKDAAIAESSSIDEAEKVEVEDNEDIDVDIEKDVEIDDEESESKIEVDSELAGESGDVAAILGLLTKAQEEAKALGDEKLMDQIGNTITYYTRAHVVAETEVTNNDVADINIDNPAEDAVVGLDEGVTRFQKLAGIIKS
jgi:hypothetical protein